MASNLMNACPRGPEFDALVNHPEIGRIQAVRDWMENDMAIRSVEEVLKKLKEENTVVSSRPTVISSAAMTEYEKKLKDRLLDFVKGLGITVMEEADDLLDNNSIVSKIRSGDATTAFDVLQKFLALRRNATLDDLKIQVAQIVYTFMGKKSRLGRELWRSIDQWSKYDEIYAMYDKKENQYEDTMYASENIEYGESERYNPWVRKQVIIHLIAEALESGVDLKAFGKEKNPDISKEFFEKQGYKDRYSQNWIARKWNRIWNFVMEAFGKLVSIRTYNEDKLISMALEIADDVFKKDYTKFIRGVVSKDGKFFNDEGIELEQKDYEQTLNKDPYAREIIEKLFKHPFIDYKLSGSQVLRKYGVVLRSVNEDLHDIDGVITLEQFRSEANSREFLQWLRTKGLQLQSEFYDTGKNDKFVKGLLPFLKQQNWYINLELLFPSWEFTTAFIGRDHKFAESVTIQGTIEHPTEIDPKTGKLKKYALDFFLRTDEGDYPEIFDNYFKDWKQIFEAKINMGRGKDMTDLVYFTPFIEDKYKFTNKGFRYFTFNKKSQASTTVDVETPLPDTKRVYRGTRTTDEGREFTYFTMNESEAKEYGETAVYDVNTQGFLNPYLDKDKYYALTLGFNKETGLVFDLLNNSKEGRETQRKFFKYMLDKGWKGLDYTDYSDSKYIVSFDSKAIKKVSNNNAVAYNRSNSNHRYALEKLERGLDNAGYPISEKGYMNYDLSSYDIGRIESIIRSCYPPDNWTLRQTQYGNWYIAGYKGKNVFSDDYYSPATRLGARRYYRYESTPNDIENESILNGKPVTFDKADNENLKAIRQATAIADTLSNKLGVRYEIISAERAQEITADSINPWNGEKAFFSDNTVYFIKDMLDPNLAVHEFSHAFIRAISLNNNKLFNNLYTELSRTQEGQIIIEDVKRLYPEFNETDNMFMEEAIVRAIELKATNNMVSKGVTKEFSGWVEKIMYHIKQLLRSIQKKFGINKDVKIDVSKINEMTTIDQLSDMLVNADAFELGDVKERTKENDSLTEKEFNAYFRSQVNEISGLAQVAPEDLRVLATQGMKAAGKTYRKILKDKNHAEMAEVLKDEFGKDNMDEIRSNLRPYTEYMEKRMSEIIDEVQYNQNHVESLVNTYFRLSKTMQKITKHLESITQDVDNPENLMRAASYRRVVKYWEDFIDYTIKVFKENNVQSDNAINQLVSGIKTQITRSNEELSKIKAAGIRETLLTVLEPIGESAKERFEQMLATYRKYKYKQYAIDRLFVEYYGMTEAEYNEYNKMKDTGQEQSPRFQKLKLKSMTGAQVTREKIEALLNGELNDVHWMNSYFEGYMYNDDPVVGGLALFVKQAIDQTTVKSQMLYNDFSKELVPLLEDIGYSPSNIGALGERVGFKDSFGKIDRDGNLQKYSVWTLLNRWKDYRWKVDELDSEVRQAELQYYKTNSKADKEKLQEANSKRDEHNALYMHQKYVPEFYRMRSDFTDNGRNKIGVKALAMRDEVLATIRNLQEKVPAQEDMFQYNDQIKNAWNEYRQLHSLIDIDGNMKQGEALQIAQELQKFRDASRKYYEYKSIPGAFENALFKEEQRLINKGYKDDAFRKAREKFINENTRVVIRPEFYQERRDLLARMKELLSKKVADPKVAEEQAKLAEAIEGNYNIIFNAVTGYRDDDGQPEATAMSEGRIAKVKEAQQNIEDLREKVIGISGLTKEEQKRLNYLDNQESLDQEQEDELMYLLEKKKSILTKEQRKELKSIFKELAALSTTEPTDYYVLQMNNVLKTLSADEDNMPALSLLKGHFGSTELDKDQMDELLRPDDTNRLILTSLLEIPEFKAWFEKNHIGTVQDVFEGKMYAGQEMVYKRTYVWNVIRPNDPAFYESYDIKDENGRILQKINRVPSLRFFKREVKKEFETGYDPATGEVKLVVGEHVDNKGRFLPRGDVANNPYTNKEYYDLKAKDPKAFKVLEALTKWHLKFQESLMDNSSKLYLDFPRFEKTTLELARTKKIQSEEGEKPSRMKLFIKNIKQFFLGSKDEPESGFGFNDEFKVAQLDIFDEDEEYHAPIHGLYDIEIDDVSTDITNSMLRYMISAQKNATLTEIFPVANALKDVLDGKGYDRFRSVSKMHLTADGEFTTRSSDQNKTRRKVVENFIDREFYGKTLTGPGAENKTLYNLSNGMFQAASLGFFAFNIQSAVKNAVGQKIQGMIEAVAGRYYNASDYAKGEAWAFKTMGELSFQIYKKGPKSLNVQLWEVFDPTLEFEKKAAKEGMSRTLLKDITNPASISMNFRKWTEMQSMMQIWAAMLYNTMVDQNGKKIQWADAWEVKDGRVQLKEGVDPEWGITYDSEGNQVIGKKFIQRRQQMQGVLAKLQGAYDDFNQPEAQRYMVFRFVSFMRRYFVPMFIDRFGFKWKNGQAQARLQTGVGGLAEGYYISLSRWLYDFFRMGPKKLISATPDERRAWLKTSADLAILYLLFWMQGALFGWDDDDDERYEKLRQKSGPLQGPFVADDEYAFNLGGWMSNHALNLAMQIRAEQAQFIPWPGYGLRNYKELVDQLGSSAAIGPTVGTGFSVAQDISNYVTGSEKAYYQREVGPYEWQQEGGSKFIAHLAKSMGMTGVFWQSELGIKKLESVEQGFASGGN